MRLLPKLLSSILVLGLMLPLVGCYDRVELESMAFASSMGLDKGEGDTIDVTFRIAVPSGSAGGEGNGGEGGDKSAAIGSKPITVRAHSISEALTLANAVVERRISLHHLHAVLIGESLAREGIQKYLDAMVRNREFRRNVNLYIIPGAPGSVREEFASNKPVLEKSAPRFFESLEDINEYTGLSPVRTVHEFVVALESPFQSPFTGLVSMNKQGQKQSGEGEGGAKDGESKIEGGVSFNPGSVARLGGNPLEMMGTAIFRRDKLVTFLDGIDSRMLLAIRGELNRTIMDFPSINPKEHVGLEMKHARSPEVNVDMASNPIRIQIREVVEGDLAEIQSQVNYTDQVNLRKLEAHIEDRLARRQTDLIERIFHQYQCDPFGIMKKAKTQFATYDEMKEFDYREKLKDAVVQVQVNLKIRRTGVHLDPVGEK